MIPIGFSFVFGRPAHRQVRLKLNGPNPTQRIGFLFDFSGFSEILFLASTYVSVFCHLAHRADSPRFVRYVSAPRSFSEARHRLHFPKYVSIYDAHVSFTSSIAPRRFSEESSASTTHTSSSARHLYVIKHEPSFVRLRPSPSRPSSVNIQDIIHPINY